MPLNKDLLAKSPEWLLRQLRNNFSEQPNKQLAHVETNIIPEGSRNDDLFRFGCSLRKNGATKEVIAAALLVKNETECTPPLSDDEIKEIVKNCSRYEQGQIGFTTPSVFGYEHRHGRTVHVTHDKDGNEKVTVLAPLIAKIISERIRDNGKESNIEFLIEGVHQNGHKFRSIVITAEEFQYGNWIILYWGTLANIGAGQGKRDHFRSAIQELSQDRKIELTYTHTGWRPIDGRYVFLHFAGAIGTDGVRSDILVDLVDGSLTDVTFPLPPIGKELISSVRESLKVLSLVPARVAYPLYLGVYRAILGDLLEINFSFFLEGASGLGKSAVAGVIQAFFGRNFNGTNLPLNFTSTVNYNEGKAFLGKNLVLVVDDYVPGSTSEYHVERLVRGQGNGAGRGRMQSDSKLRQTYYSRAMLLLTGEAPLRGTSVIARTLVLSIKDGDVDFNLLTELQTSASNGILSEVTSSFIQWVAPQMDELKVEFRKLHTELRQQAAQSQMHKRTPDIIAQLGATLRIFLKFAEEKKVITSEESKEMWVNGWSALGEVAYQQIAFQANENIALQFVNLIKSSFVMGKPYLMDAKKDVPPVDAKLLGWSGTTDYPDSLQARGAKIGWYNPEEDEIWLLPDAAFAITQEIARLQGAQLPVTKDVVWKRLAQENLIITQKDKNLNRRTPSGGNRQMVVVFPSKVFLDKAQAPVAPVTPASIGNGAGGVVADLKEHFENKKRQSEIRTMQQPDSEVNL